MTVFYPRLASGFSYSPANNPASLSSFRPSEWTLNLTTTSNASGVNAYYADVDSVVRPGDAFRRNATSGDGCVLFHTDTTHDAHDGRRPVILNRPFNSVGELGYVYRDEPFKNLDL